MSSRQNDALAKRYGKLLVDFANAKDTNQACVSFLGHINSLFSFTPKAIDQIAKVFPMQCLGSGVPGGLNNKILALILEKKRLISELNEQFSEINYAIDDFDPLSNTVSLVSLNWKRGATDPLLEGDTLDAENVDKGGFLQTLKILGLSIVDGPVSIQIDAIKDEIEKRMGSNTLAQFNQLVRFSHSIEDGQKIIELHKKLENIQAECKKLLNSVIAGHSLSQNPSLSRFLSIYNGMQTNQLAISDDDCLIYVSPIDENMFLGVKEIGGWYDLLLNTFSYCVVGFLGSKRATRFLKSCQLCKKYIIAKKSNQKFCAANCRLVWNKKKAV